MNRASKSKVHPPASPSTRLSNRINVLHDHLIPSGTTNSSDPTTVSQHRFKRAPPPPADKLGEFATHIQLTARIVNGISLQNGLIGTNATTSITANDVMTELLRMGSLTPDLLIAIKPAEVEQILKEFEDLTGNLVENKDVTKIEENYKTMNEVTKTQVNFEEFGKLTGMTTYSTILDKVAATTLTDAYFTKIITVVTELKNVLVTIKDLKSDVDPSRQAQEHSELQRLFFKFQEVETEMQKFPTDTKDLLENLRTLSIESAFISLLITESDARKQFMYTQNTNTENLVKGNIQKFEKASKVFKNQEKLLNQLTSFVASRQSGEQGDVKYTAGFPSKINDLQRLSTDTGSTWFMKSINGSQVTSQNLKKGLLPLDEFKANLNTVEAAWKPATQTIQSAETVLKKQVSMVEQLATATTGKTTMGEFKKCYTTNIGGTALDTEAIEPNFVSIRELDGKVKKLSKSDYARLSDFTDLKNIVAYQGITQLADFHKETSVVAKKMKDKQAEIDEIVEVLETFLADVQVLNDIVKTLPTTAAKIKDDLQLITNYHKDVTSASTFPKIVDCVNKKVGANGVIVSEMIATLQEVRAMKKTKVVAEARTFFSTIFDSVDSLNKTKTSVGNMKKVTDIETTSLSMLSDSMKISQNLGNAAQGIKNISEADKIQKKLEPLTGNVQYIKDSAKIRQTALGNHFQHLQSIETLNTELKALIKVFDNVKKSFNNFNATTLADNGPIFKAAEPIKSITKVDFVNVKAAVKELKNQDSSNAKELDKVLVALDELEKLDLDFANSKFSSVPDDLQTLDLFFANYTLLTTATQATPIDNNLGGGLGASPVTVLVPQTAATSVSDTSSNVWGIVGGSVGGGLAAAAIGGVGFFFWRRHNKNKEKENVPPPKVVDLVLVFHLPEEVVEKIERESKDHYKTSRQFFEDEFNVCQMISQVDKVPIEEKNVPKCRYKDMYVINSTAVKLPEMPDEATEKGEKGEKPFIHANVMRMAETEWIMSQGPLDGSETFKTKRVSTLETHWWMIEQKDVALSIQLCQFVEDEKIKCAMYYPEKVGNTMKVGMYTLKCLKNVVPDGKLFVDPENYTLFTIQYERNGVKKTTDILRFITWPDQKAPENPDYAADMVLFADTYKKNVLVHCSAGVGRTGTLVGVKKGVEMCMTGQKPGLNQVLSAVRECRYSALQTSYQIAYMVLGITRVLIRTTNNKMFVPSYPALKYYYSHWNSYLVISQPKRTPNGEPLVNKDNEIEFVPQKVEPKPAEKKSAEKKSAETGKTDELKKDEKGGAKPGNDSGNGKGTEAQVEKIEYEKVCEFLYPKDARADLKAQHEAVEAAKAEWDKNKKEAKVKQEADKKEVDKKGGDEKGGDKKGKGKGKAKKSGEKGKKSGEKGKKSGEKTKTKSGGSTGTSASVSKSAQSSQTGSKMGSKQE